MKGRRRFRPGIAGLFGMMLVNGVISYLVLRFVYALFGVGGILPQFAANHAWAQAAAKWDLFGPLLPGAAIGFGLLWFWLILTGRTERGLSWGSAWLYGVFIAIFDVPLAGLLIGLVNGNPFLGALIGLVMVLLAPSLLLSMITFGLTMGSFNGWRAQR